MVQDIKIGDKVSFRVRRPARFRRRGGVTPVQRKVIDIDGDTVIVLYKGNRHIVKRHEVISVLEAGAKPLTLEAAIEAASENRGIYVRSRTGVRYDVGLDVLTDRASIPSNFVYGYFVDDNPRRRGPGYKWFYIDQMFLDEDQQ